jgi:hypothetical protein
LANGDDPDQCVMEVMRLYMVPEDREVQKPIGIHWLAPEGSWSAAEELGGLGAIFDQDAANFAAIQAGLKAGGAASLTLSSYGKQGPALPPDPAQLLRIAYREERGLLAANTPIATAVYQRRCLPAIATTAATAATLARLLLVCFVDPQCAAFNLVTVQFSDSTLAIFARHFHKTKTPGTPGVTISDHTGRGYGADVGKHGFQVGIRGTPRKIAYINFHRIVSNMDRVRIPVFNQFARNSLLCRHSARRIRN